MTDTVAQAAEAWQPIETAPKEVSVLVWGDEEIAIAVLYKGVWNAVEGFVKPTHWMPLPKPPSLRAVQTTGGDER